MTALDDALAEAWEAHRHAEVCLDILENQNTQRQEAEELRRVVGTLAGIARTWEIERDRWR